MLCAGAYQLEEKGEKRRLGGYRMAKKGQKGLKKIYIYTFNFLSKKKMVVVFSQTFYMESLKCKKNSKFPRV